MSKTQCVLALVALYMGLAQSWDIAVSLENELLFYTNGLKTDTVRFNSQNLTALVYDEVHNMMLYVDKQNDHDSICGYNLLSMENKCFIKRIGSNIQDIAFDPAKDLLFFTDTNERSINWISLKPGSNNNVNLFIKMDDGTPTDIAVDSCSGYIYWTNTNLKEQEFMKRARFDGSKTEVMHKYLVHSIAVDPQTRKVYYLDGVSGRFFNSKGLDGLHEDYFLLLGDSHISNPKELTVSNDYLYWMNSSVSYKTVWQIPKNKMNRLEIKEVSKFYTDTPLGIVVNYKIKNIIQGLQDCEALSKLIPAINIQQTSETEQTAEYTKVAELYCVHGIKVNETSVCECTPGYIGERCDVSVCENYCFEGDCSFKDEGLPTCRCNAGYSGKRCEVYACHGYCLNSGDCSLNEEAKPVCQCVGNHKGIRCEAVKDDFHTTISTPMFSAKRKHALVDLLSKCLNYCLQGICSLTDDGPLCSCNAGYSGVRCEVYACHGYCLNGVCFLNEEDAPVCKCVGNHEGPRCEAVKDTLINDIRTYDSAKGNLTLADILSSWRKPTSKMFLTVEV